MTATYQIDGVSMHYYMPKELDHHIAQGLLQLILCTLGFFCEILY